MFIHLNKTNPSVEFISKVAREVVHVHDWLVGPASSERDRLMRDLAECEGQRRSLSGR